MTTATWASMATLASRASLAKEHFRAFELVEDSRIGCVFGAVVWCSGKIGGPSKLSARDTKLGVT
jgi:hypothetical protein